MKTEISSKHAVVSRAPYMLYMAFTDMRNFAQMVPEDKKNEFGLQADYDSVHAVVPASSRRTLASQMSEADYHALLPRDAPQHAREDTSQNKKPEIQIKSRLLELISGCGS